MKVRSIAQLNKLKELLAQKFITQADFDIKTSGVNLAKLPERVSTNTKHEVKKTSSKPAHKRAW